METLLIIDDNIKFADDLELMLNSSYRVLKADTSSKGLEILKKQHVSVVLLDLKLPDIHGLEVLKIIRNEYDNSLPVIIITDYDDTEYVVKAMRLGAFDFLSKDFHVDLMIEKIEQSIQQKNLKLRVSGMQTNVLSTEDTFVFASEEMKKLNFEITKIANWDFDVLLQGETGVGKDMISSQIYMRSIRKEKPYIPVPLRSLSETLLESELFGHEKGAFTGADKLKIGKFEAANQGIVYLPEISNLPEAIQLKLLHFMQYKSITRVGHDSRKGEIGLDVRMIMATNENLQALVESGKMREDFYYRITGVTLKIPPLRERREDILPLSDYFLHKFSLNSKTVRYKFSEEVLDAFMKHEWRGNVRELSNSIKNALTYAEGNVLRLKDFPNIASSMKKSNPVIFKDLFNAGAGEIPKYKEYEHIYKKAYFENLMSKNQGKINDAANDAGVTPQGLRKILKTLKIQY